MYRESESYIQAVLSEIKIFTDKINEAVKIGD